MIIADGQGRLSAAEASLVNRAPTGPPAQRFNKIFDSPSPIHSRTITARIWRSRSGLSPARCSRCFCSRIGFTRSRVSTDPAFFMASSRYGIARSSSSRMACDASSRTANTSLPVCSAKTRFLANTRAVASGNSPSWQSLSPSSSGWPPARAASRSL